MHVIQLSERSHLVLDDTVRPRWLIVEGPMVRRETGETHLVHRVEWWHRDPKRRHIVAVCEGMVAARTWCAAEIDRVRQDQEALSATLDIRNQVPGSR
ncbi:hypothetical protein J2Y69_002153 [Microbacterium resistens]|uniref:Uncharacterized protein n=1 Tax=Microbacterium resistens TaxID=156977 RepID=A0ABU1SD81_9MICO|nr:hypothetical protein [Microbacterium resistens]MDR6867549.1 hypothetical protein [Microbacterium resistens]